MAFDDIQRNQTDGGVFDEEGRYLACGTVSLLAELPEELHESLRDYLDRNPDWDQDRVFAAALSLFLLQNSTTPEASKHYRPTARVYLDSLFLRQRNG